MNNKGNDKNRKPLEHRAKTKNGVKRLSFTGISILMELMVILLINFRVNEYAEWIAISTRLFAALLVLFIYNQNKTAALKMPWIILIMMTPILGVTLYVLTGLNGGTHRMRRRYAEIDKELFPLLPDQTEVLERLSAADRRMGNIAHYIHTHAGYPAYDRTRIRYFADAAEALEAQKADLRRARRYIFMEYHAIEEKQSWLSIQEILAERVAAGVEVRVFYDDIGSIGFISTDFVKRLEALGIRAKVFNPVGPGLNLFLNNRDHRKITVIDGEIGYTGGYNLANEYFNITHPYGHWKDTGVRLEGDAVNSLTITFLEMWNAVSDKDVNDPDLGMYLQPRSAGSADTGAEEAPETAETSGETPAIAQAPSVREAVSEAVPEGNGYVIPYADSPMDDEHVGEDVYISLAEYAQSYVWYVTPYLILTDEMIHALGLAAKRGVDVRIITPGIPDKKLIYSITRSYYHSLVRQGVRIFEYTPGFCHCKMCVTDDLAAICGTINLDYRSLYHHFENGCLYYGSQAVLDTRKDFEETMALCREVTENYHNPGSGMRLIQLILRLFAPLM